MPTPLLPRGIVAAVSDLVVDMKRDWRVIYGGGAGALVK
jgi:hypothetical protein